MIPLENFGGMLIRALTKPIVGEMKVLSKQFPSVKSACEDIGRRIHRWNVISHVSVRSTGKIAIRVKEISSDQAFKKGTEFIGEACIFIVAVGVLTADYTRNSAKAALKEKAQVEENYEEFLLYEARFRQLEASMRQMNRTRSELNASLDEIVSKSYKLD